MKRTEDEEKTKKTSFIRTLNKTYANIKREKKTKEFCFFL